MPWAGAIRPIACTFVADSTFLKSAIKCQSARFFLLFYLSLFSSCARAPWRERRRKEESKRRRTKLSIRAFPNRPHYSPPPPARVSLFPCSIVATLFPFGPKVFIHTYSFSLSLPSLDFALRSSGGYVLIRLSKLFPPGLSILLAHFPHPPFVRVS